MDLGVIGDGGNCARQRSRPLSLDKTCSGKRRVFFAIHAWREVLVCDGHFACIEPGRRKVAQQIVL